MERYVVEGGEFPLPRPLGIEDQSRWRDVLLDFQTNLTRLGDTEMTLLVVGCRKHVDKMH